MHRYNDHENRNEKQNLILLQTIRSFKNIDNVLFKLKAYILMLWAKMIEIDSIPSFRSDVPRINQTGFKSQS